MKLTEIQQIDKERIIGIILKYVDYGTEIVVNDDMSVDVDGDVRLYSEGLHEIPVKFHKVTGDFDCSNNSLTTLRNCPEYVGNAFDCSDNKLTTMKYCPQYVGKKFDCSENNLDSLEGVPRIIHGLFDCANNGLTDLVGGPREVAGSFRCSNNPLTSLKGCPVDVGGEFVCIGDKAPMSVDSLEGLPRYIGGEMWLPRRYAKTELPRGIKYQEVRYK